MGTKHSRNGFLENGGADLLKDLACSNSYNGTPGNLDNLLMNNRFNNPYGLGPYQVQLSHQQQIDAAKSAGITTNDLIVGNGPRLMRGTTDASKNGDEYDTRNHRTSVNGSMSNYKRKPGSGNFYGHSNTRNAGGDSWRNSYYQKSSSKAPTKSSLLQELLECPICMNLFDNPHVLPCQHTFCKKCIISLQGADSSESNGSSSATSNTNNTTNNTISCPICRESHRLPNGIEGLSANYTMKRLIELESMAEKEKTKNKEKAKCFLCQNYGYLKVCEDCSYMLCVDCIDDPDHDIRIDLKMKAKVRSTSNNSQPTNFATMVKAQSRYAQPMHDYAGRCDIYADRMQPQPTSNKVKLILLCHSSAVEAMAEKINAEKQPDMQQSITSAVGINGGKYEVYEDEYGKCTTFSKINIPTSDRVITLKKIVETKFGISCNDQILVYKDNVLKNDLKPLHHYRLRQFSRIHIFDQRDIKDNASDDELFGIYQDANISQSGGDSLPNANKRPQGMPTPNLAENRKKIEPSSRTDRSTSREVASLQQQMQQHGLTERMPSSAKYTKVTRVEDYMSPRLGERKVKREHSKNHHSSSLHPHTNSNSDESSDSYDFEEIGGVIDYKPSIKRTTNMCNSMHIASVPLSGSSQYRRHNSVSRVRKLDELFDQQLTLSDH